jgi:hypothetical protein
MLWTFSPPKWQRKPRRAPVTRCREMLGGFLQCELPEHRERKHRYGPFVWDESECTREE